MRDLDQLLRQHVDERTPREAPPFDGVVEDARRGGEGMPRSAPRARGALLAAASVVAVALGTWGAVSLLGDDRGPGREVAAPSSAPAERTGALPDGGAASCAFEPTEANLAQRSFAFDGTVAAIGAGTAPTDGDDLDLGYATVTFDVERWFAGGSDDQVQVQMTPPVDGGGAPDESAEGGPSYGVGTRLLVSGEPRWGGDDPLADAVVWGCGFTVYHDPQTAEVWDRVFAP